MLETAPTLGQRMYVRCTHCGYDNSPEYRFCGMCGASLAHQPAPQAAQATETVRPPKGGEGESVHGPSFLGLAEDPKVEFHYLYEDEEPKSRAGLVFVVLLLLGAGGFLGWQWRNNGFPFNRLNAATSADSSGSPASASPSEAAPGENQDQETHINKPMTGAGDVLPTQPDESAKTQGPAKPTEADIPPESLGLGQPTQNAGSTQNPSPSENSRPAGSAAQKTPAEEKSQPAQEAKATPPPSVTESGRPQRQPEPVRRSKSQPTPPAPAAIAPDADLEATGERYLYGTGLPQNCTRAENSLRTAALHGNSKAQTVLGTMYATGHCVTRDLPTAYRWFARALHQEPQNTRISVDLQVLWRQMTPQEKQLAMSGQSAH
ncbi:MAG: hypothetical protein J2P13_01955 [Acidobacteria bacterium]|nr:hypothetical protein [Acidobacteriota bacterium]